MGSPHGRQSRAGRPSRPVVPALTVLLVLSLALGGYLWFSTVRWQADSATWEAKAREHADTVADQRAALAAVDAELVAAREQLATATDRITDLANEKAQLGDRNVASQQHLDQQTRVSETAGAVADALDACIRAQATLIDDLEVRADADGAEATRTPTDEPIGEPTGTPTGEVAAEADTLCAQAADAHDRLQEKLSEDAAP